MSLDSILGWVAIGAAASLAGMIWPFRRGTLGIVVNLAAGIGGAVLAGLIGCAVARPIAGHGGTHLVYAAVGALVVLGLTHAIWAARIPPARRQSEVAQRRPVA